MTHATDLRDRNPLEVAPARREASFSGSSFDDPYTAPPCGEGIGVTGLAAVTPVARSLAILSGGFGVPPGSHVVRQAQPYGGRFVWLIGPDRVWLSTATTLCQVPLGPPSTVAAEPVPAGRPVAASWVTERSPGEYSLDRAFVEKTLANPAALLRGLRGTPEERGLRLFGIKPDGIGSLGIENGDLLQSINGFDLTSPEKALEAYARLRTADSFTLQMQRKGQAVTLRYEVR